MGIYAILGLIWSIFYTLPFLYSLEINAVTPDIFYTIYFSLPIILVVLSLIALVTNKFISNLFWVSLIYWFFITIGELIEGEPYNPNLFGLIFMLVASVILVLFKIISNKENERGPI